MSRDEHTTRVELLNTERVRHVPEQPPGALKPITPARAMRNREILAAALAGVEDEPDGVA